MTLFERPLLIKARFLSSACSFGNTRKRPRKRAGTPRTLLCFPQILRKHSGPFGNGRQTALRPPSWLIIAACDPKHEPTPSCYNATRLYVPPQKTVGSYLQWFKTSRAQEILQL
jgi:hypothetical protein